MGKEIVVTSLEQMCDLMCGGPEPEEEETKRCETCKYGIKEFPAFPDMPEEDQCPAGLSCKLASEMTIQEYEKYFVYEVCECPYYEK